VGIGWWKSAVISRRWRPEKEKSEDLKKAQART
jgi:hypothetical protein